MPLFKTQICFYEILFLKGDIEKDAVNLDDQVLLFSWDEAFVPPWSRLLTTAVQPLQVTWHQLHHLQVNLQQFSLQSRAHSTTISLAKALHFISKLSHSPTNSRDLVCDASQPPPDFHGCTVCNKVQSDTDGGKSTGLLCLALSLVIMGWGRGFSTMCFKSIFCSTATWLQCETSIYHVGDISKVLLIVVYTEVLLKGPHPGCPQSMDGFTVW